MFELLFCFLSLLNRLQSELMALMMSGDSGISAFPEEDNIFCWKGKISSSKDTVFEGTEYKGIIAHLIIPATHLYVVIGLGIPEANLTPEAKDLICRLLCDAEHKLGTGGADQIKDAEWDKLYEMEAAYKTEVNEELDTQNSYKLDLLCKIKVQLSDSAQGTRSPIRHPKRGSSQYGHRLAPAVNASDEFNYQSSSGAPEFNSCTSGSLENWMVLPVTADKPAPRFNLAAAMVGNKMVIVGSESGNKLLDDVQVHSYYFSNCFFLA
ncbi:hypothetical protein ACH5RR_003208 [Cinchona calisaya]|uniref:Uncharacterized protein n=1 Tax=Cinchona calisaya TaxID=153742 RepID=A0ABD3AUU6_9GENT